MEGKIVEWLEKNWEETYIDPNTIKAIVGTDRVCFLSFFKYWVNQGKEDPSTTLWRNWPKQSMEMTNKMRTEEWVMLNDNVFMSHLLKSKVFEEVKGPIVELGQTGNGGYLEYTLKYTFVTEGKQGEIMIDQSVLNENSEFSPMDLELTVQVQTECYKCKKMSCGWQCDFCSKWYCWESCRCKC